MRADGAQHRLPGVLLAMQARMMVAGMTREARLMMKSSNVLRVNGSIWIHQIRTALATKTVM